MGKIPLKNKKRLVAAFAIFCAVLVVLCFRTGYIQIVKGDEYTKLAIEQQTADATVEPERGNILDRNGTPMAVSTLTYSVWVRPSSLYTSEDDNENQARVNEVAEGLAGILNMEADDIRKMLDTDNALVKVAKYKNKQTADKVREWASEKQIDGVSISEDTKRFYPMNDLAAQVLGSVTDEGEGLSGLELYYNSYLKGVPGRWIQSTDASGKTLSYGDSKYYEPQNGDDLVLTLDVTIQSYAEDECIKVMKEQNAKRVSCIVMSTKTGEILAMASVPSFDPNNPRIPEDVKERAAFRKMSEKDQMDYLNKMWRNPLVNDTYVPGSTMKLMTTSMALEEDLTTVDESFYDSGSITVDGIELKCWSWKEPHGQETLKKAVRNSCNPVFVQLARRIGAQDFYSYLNLFGLDTTTGIDYPGEATSQIQDINTVGNVGLSTMGYGQGIAVTPIEQISAVNSIANGGKLMQPHLVKEIKDEHGKTVKKFEPVVVRNTVSKETADTVLDIMGFVVSDGGAGKTRVQGYNIGGKTGTSNVESEGNRIVASFVGVAPLEDPEITVLFIVDTPKNAIYGSTVAAPGGMMVIEDTLKYLSIEPTSKVSDSSTAAQITVPNVTGQDLSTAKKALKDAGLKYQISPKPDKEKNFTIVDQYPKAGSKIKKGGTVFLYSQ